MERSIRRSAPSWSGTRRTRATCSSPSGSLRDARDVPYAHHERWDGSGYPRRLKGEEIPLAARIFAVVDVYDALTSDRPYRPAWSEEEARAYLARAAGRLFDPAVVAAFLELPDPNERV
jgi:HD-GYP domain-containing protein (c-di-GMP phosphodiesterase class II)